MFKKSFVVYQNYRDPPKFPLKRRTFEPVPPLKRGARGDLGVFNITAYTF
jgi:hypothetical protein